MRKKLLSLLLCFQIIFSAISPIFSMAVGSEDPEAPGSSGNDTAQTSPTDSVVQSIFPESELVWKSFRDYLLDQARTAWNYPESYVGYEVMLLPCWSSLLCRSGFDNNEEAIEVEINNAGIMQIDTIDLEQTKLVIDAYHYDENEDALWYKVKAAEGYVLPQVLEEHPYILQFYCEDIENGMLDVYPPTFLIGPLKAVFNAPDGTVTIKKQPEMASRFDTVDVSDLSSVIDVKPLFSFDNSNDSYVWNYYDIGDIASAYTDYQYADVESITVIPVEASVAYDQLMNAEDTYEYYSILSQIPNSVLAQLSNQHKAQLDICIEELVALEQVTYETTVNFNGVGLPVSVIGKLPDNVTLQASIVSDAEVLAEGFEIESVDDIVAALDIKLINNEDGTEWQPKEGRRIGVSIGVGALGYEDNQILRLQHKHGKTIESYDIVVVEDGAVTVFVGGFSIFVMNENQAGVTPNNNARPLVTDGSTLELEVGKSTVYYFKLNDNNNNLPDVGTWAVNDPTGAIHYTVHSKSSIGNGGMQVMWIRITALKAANGITLTYNYRTNNTTRSQTFTLNVVTPKAEKGQTALYIKDDVNNSGRIIATLVDENGKEVEGALDGAAFSWTRSDDYYITPKAYGDEFRSVNIAVDHGGLVEARKNAAGTAFEPTKYTVDVILSNGEKLSASYTVYYQSEIINADFEFPATSTNQNYTYFPNGWPELYWETTAPGQGNKISMDIEYGYPTGQGTSWGVTHAATGKQFAEINAEAFGALYQDIITAPGEDIDWDFAHGPRQNQSWSGDISNAMFIVIGATEDAQKLNHTDLEKLGAQAKTAAGNNNQNFLSGKEPVKITYNSAEYYVWYHDAGTVAQNNNRPYQGEDGGWTKLEGSYTVPDGQYRTRLFFVSEKKYQNSQNAGNLIDATRAGQYKNFLIEYYIGKVDTNNQLIYERLEGTETGEELIYSSKEIMLLDQYITQQKQYLHKILINGENYPYSVRYQDKETGEEKAFLYIEKYPFASDFPKNDPRYKDYDIVMQVYLREVVISVQKELVFPAELTEEQKLNIMTQFQAAGGYIANFETVSVNSGDYAFEDKGVATITQRDPVGKYTGYYSVEKYPEKNHTYRVQEGETSDIPGLVLKSTTYLTYLYDNGKRDEGVVSPADQPYSQFTFTHSKNFAEIFVVNTYEEKMTTIRYHAVGNGKVAFVGEGIFLDTPTETLKYYSDLAKGADIYPGIGATFVGWYKDPECKIPVTAKDGYWDPNTNSFKPNANIITDTEVDFYAKFETGTIVINRENAKPNQSFVYHIQSNGIDMYITLHCDENGKGSVQVLEVPLNQTYTITECDDWSWRYPSKSLSQTNSNEKKLLEYLFNEAADPNAWLNGFTPPQKNVFKGNK